MGPWSRSGRDQGLVGARALFHHARPQVGAGQRGPYVVIPLNWPPVMLSTWPWTKFDHGEQRKNTPPAASDGEPGRPTGISIGAIWRIWSGIPSCTFSPPISATFDSSLDAVRRVSM